MQILFVTQKKHGRNAKLISCVYCLYKRAFFLGGGGGEYFDIFTETYFLGISIPKKKKKNSTPTPKRKNTSQRLRDKGQDRDRVGGGGGGGGRGGAEGEREMSQFQFESNCQLAFNIFFLSSKTMFFLIFSDLRG